jgi:hypothetical protein
MDRDEATRAIDRPSEIRHLLRAVKTALELAVVSRVPIDLLNCLARPAGLLEAVAQLPSDAPSVEALIPSLMDEARSALERWERWNRRRAPAA